MTNKQAKAIKAYIEDKISTEEFLEIIKEDDNNEQLNKKGDN